MKGKQAVVVIHGIGEQRPLETLRSFVKAVFPELKGKYRSKPDRMAESFELRCLQAPSSSSQPITDFYEYYWAHHMRDSKLSGVFMWLWSLLIKPFWKVPRGLRPIYFLTYVGLFLALGLLLWGFWDQEGQSILNRTLSIYKAKQFYFALVTVLGVFICNRFLLGYVADAARYLTPTPDNIAERNKIRAEGIQLLRSLHNSGKYSRIIVIGHSLGSVIGYDILRHLWVEMREPTLRRPFKQKVAKDFDSSVQKIFSQHTLSTSSVEAFQQIQHELWREHREIGIPWLVTDFITLGSPLTYSSLLLTESPEEFLERKQEYEFPCCPPLLTQPTHYSKQYDSTPHPINFRIPHHGAVFASTRWTNIFFPYRMGVFGDVIGGALASSLGNGIKDIPVHPSGAGFIRKTLYSHVCYWKLANSKSTKHKNTTLDSLKALRSAMRLESS